MSDRDRDDALPRVAFFDVACIIRTRPVGIREIESVQERPRKAQDASCSIAVQADEGHQGEHAGTATEHDKEEENRSQSAASSVHHLARDPTAAREVCRGSRAAERRRR